jgi:hypothetical protein
MKRRAVVLGALAVGTALVAVAPAAAHAGTFSGSCDIAGPISPRPPITVIPRPGPHFDYEGTGTCTGQLDGGAKAKVPAMVRIRNGSTLFDTCELGPDFNLRAMLILGPRHHRERFAITVQLARLAVVGPLAVTTPGGGRAVGIGRFSTTDDPTECISGGVAHASLEVSFSTLSPLISD